MQQVHSLRGWSAAFAWGDATLLVGIVLICLVILGYLIRTRGGTHRRTGLFFSAGLLALGLLVSAVASQLLTDVECYIPADNACHGFIDLPIWLRMALVSWRDAAPAFFAATGGGLFAYWVTHARST